MNCCLRSLVLIFIISAWLSPAVMGEFAAADKPAKEEPTPAAAAPDKTAKEEPAAAAKGAKEEPAAKPAKEEPAAAKSAKEEPVAAAAAKPAKEEPAAAARTPHLPRRLIPSSESRLKSNSTWTATSKAAT